MSRSGILVLSTLGVGDVLLAAPLFEALRMSTKERIVLLARAGSPAELARRLGYADLVVDYVARWPHRLWGGLTLLPWVARQRFRVVMATTGLNAHYCGMVALASSAPIRIGERRGAWTRAWTRLVEVDPTAHIVACNKAIGLAAGVEAGDSPRFTPNDRERAAAEELVPGEKPSIALAPGSNRSIAHKRWPVEKFGLLAVGLRERGARVIVLGGPDEHEIGHRIRSHAGGRDVVDLIGATDVGTAAGVLSRCRAAIGNDGMILHLAAAVGIPTVTIFGPSDHRRFAPRNPRGVVVRRELPCSPCDDRRGHRCAERHCLQAIEVDDVLGALDGVLTPGGPPDEPGGLKRS